MYHSLHASMMLRRDALREGEERRHTISVLQVALMLMI